MHTHTHTHIYPHAHPHTHTHTHTCTHRHADTDRHTDTRTHACTHARTHTHTRHQQISKHWKDGPSGTHTHREREGAMGSAPGMPAHVKALRAHFPKCIYIRLSTSLMTAEATTSHSTWPSACLQSAHRQHTHSQRPAYCTTHDKME